ncbi:MAG: M48 family metallopeptidase, partial [Acidobacteria bacterium]|nr:M48 family metallopeptidase [Acidobacteriota bacterium]
VLWLCSAFYYGSMPLLLLSVLAVGGGLLYGLFATGFVPIKIAAIIVILTLVTLWSILRSLFVRVRDEDPGLRLDPARAPELRTALDEVARRVGTRAVDNVYLTPGTEIAVMERGGILRQLAGSRERCLILGVGALEGMSIRPFKAILAHEYGHFSNQDTAGGGFALAVRRSLGNMAAMLAGSGAAAWYNPAWLFLIGFHRMFLRISQGASRLQEVLADRWAAFLYGSRSFEEGLRHVIARSVQFEAHVSVTLLEVSQKSAALANLYTFRPEKGWPETSVATVVESALAAPASPYDSHPAPADRLAWVRSLAAEGPARSSEDEKPVWSLFLDRETIERQQTDMIRQNVRQLHGLEIPAGGPPGASGS